MSPQRSNMLHDRTPALKRGDGMHRGADLAVLIVKKFGPATSTVLQSGGTGGCSSSCTEHQLTR